ncbi:MAG: hypothetical protein ACXWUG_21290 [Polyangiales bacterium]
MAVDLVCDVCVEAQVGYAHGGELLLPSSEHQNETWNAFVSGFTGVARVVSGLTLGMTARYEHLVFPAPTGPDVNLAYGELFAGFVLARGRAIEHGPRLGVGTFWVPKNGRAEIGAIDVRYWVSGRVSERWSIVGEAGLWFSHATPTMVDRSVGSLSMYQANASMSRMKVFIIPTSPPHISAVGDQATEAKVTLVSLRRTSRRSGLRTWH